MFPSIDELGVVRGHSWTTESTNDSTESPVAFAHRTRVNSLSFPALDEFDQTFVDYTLECLDMENLTSLHLVPSHGASEDARRVQTFIDITPKLTFLSLVLDQFGSGNFNLYLNPLSLSSYHFLETVEFSTLCYIADDATILSFGDRWAAALTMLSSLLQRSILSAVAFSPRLHIGYYPCYPKFEDIERWKLGHILDTFAELKTLNIRFLVPSYIKHSAEHAASLVSIKQGQESLAPGQCTLQVTWEKLSCLRTTACNGTASTLSPGNAPTSTHPTSSHDS